MTQFTKKSFTLLATYGNTHKQAVATCKAVGHAWADKKGRCVRCGDAIDTKAPREAVNK